MGEKRKDNPEWVSSVSDTGRKSWKKVKTADEASVSTGGDVGLARSDFLSQESEDRGYADMITEIEDAVDAMESDGWDGTNVLTVFNDHPTLELLDCNENMVSNHLDMIIRDKATGTYFNCYAYAWWDDVEVAHIDEVVQKRVDVRRTVLDKMGVNDDVLEEKALVDSFMDFARSVDRDHAGHLDDLRVGMRIIENDRYIDVMNSLLSLGNSDDNPRHFHTLTPSQERGMMDEPLPFSLNVYLGHNGQMHNGRVYEVGYVYVDEELGRGFVIIGEQASEGVGSSDYAEFTDGVLKANAEYSDDYPVYGISDKRFMTFSLTDETTESIYYRKV